MANILVTGAAGFVGANLCNELRARDIPFTASVRHSRAEGEVAIGHLSATTDWTAALRGCDVVVHLAARVHVMNDASADPLAAFRETNVEATLNLARQAVHSGVKRFVFVSSVKVNGEATVASPFTCFDVPAPQDPYGRSKAEAEQALRALSLDSGMKVVVVRPPLVYGPGVRANFLRLMQLVKSGLPLPLNAIRNRRSMVALPNLIDLLIACCRHPNAAGQTFMVSDDCDVSTPELIRMLARPMAKRALLFHLPAGIISSAFTLLGKADAGSRLYGSLQVDIGHTKSALGWTPAVGMQEAIDQTVAHFLTRHS